MLPSVTPFSVSASLIVHLRSLVPSRRFHTTRPIRYSSTPDSESLDQTVADGKDALRKGNIGQATASLNVACKTLLDTSQLAQSNAREIFRALTSTYLSQIETRPEILDTALKYMRPISRIIDKPIDKATIAEGLLLDIVSAVFRSSLSLMPSTWTPVFVRLSEVQNVVHRHEARVAASIIGTRLHLLEGDKAAAKSSAERALSIAKDNTRHQAEALVALGEVAAAGGDISGAKELYKRALSLVAPSQRPADASSQKPATFAPPTEEFIDFVVDLRVKVGKAAVQEKDWRTAEDYYGDAIKNAERLYGRGSVRVAGLLHQVALMYATRGHFWDTYAEGLFKKATSIHEEHAMRDQAYLLLLEDYCALLAKNPSRSSELEQAKQQVERVKARLA